MRNNEELYTQWLDHRRQTVIPETFSKDIMAAIDKAANGGRWSFDSAFFLRFQHPLAKWATALGLVLIGLFRILFVTGSLFRASIVMP